MTERSCTRDPQTEILHKCSYSRRSWHRHLTQKVLIHRSCTSAPAGFSSGDSEHLAQEILMHLQDLDAKILTQRSCARDPYTEWSYKILVQRSSHRDTHKRSAYRDLAQVVLLRRSWHRHLAQEILIHRSCTSAPTGSCWGDPDTDILHKKFSYRDLAQVALEAADAEILLKTSCRSGTTGSWCRDPDTDLASTISKKKTPQHCLGSLAGIIISCFIDFLKIQIHSIWLWYFARLLDLKMLFSVLFAPFFGGLGSLVFGSEPLDCLFGAFAKFRFGQNTPQGCGVVLVVFEDLEVFVVGLRG